MLGKRCRRAADCEPGSRPNDSWSRIASLDEFVIFSNKIKILKILTGNDNFGKPRGRWNCSRGLSFDRIIRSIEIVNALDNFSTMLHLKTKFLLLKLSACAAPLSRLATVSICRAGSETSTRFHRTHSADHQVSKFSGIDINTSPSSFPPSECFIEHVHGN